MNGIHGTFYSCVRFYGAGSGDWRKGWQAQAPTWTIRCQSRKERRDFTSIPGRDFASIPVHQFSNSALSRLDALASPTTSWIELLDPPEQGMLGTERLPMFWSHIPNITIVSCTSNRTQHDIGNSFGCTIASTSATYSIAQTTVQRQGPMHQLLGLEPARTPLLSQLCSDSHQP